MDIRIYYWTLVVGATCFTLVIGRTVMVEPGDPSKTQFVLEGDSFTLACRDTQAKPILWEKDGTPISTYGLHRPVITSWVTTEYQTKITLTSLIVRDAGVTDEGVYGCSGMDERPQTVNVVVLSLRTMDAQLSGRWERGHNEAILKCDPDNAALFNAHMLWYKDGEPIAVQAETSRVTLLDNNHTLLMRDLHYPEDTNVLGGYECVLKLPSRGRTYSKRAYIKAAAIIDSVYGEGDADNILVNCAGHSYPIPEVTWRKDGHVANPHTEKYDIITSETEGGGFISTLVIHEFGDNDYGNYSCMVDSLKEDYVLDDSKVLVFDAAYYSSIDIYTVNTTGVVIGSIVAVIILFYIIVVVVVILVLFTKRRQATKKRLTSEENPPEDQDESLQVNTPRPRRGTMSETHSLGLPMNNLGPPSSDLDDYSVKETTGSVLPDDVDTDSDNSIHKEKIPTSGEDSSPEHPVIDVEPPTENDPLLQENGPVMHSTPPPRVIVDGASSDEDNTNVRDLERPPSLHDILESERQRNGTNTDSDSDTDAPPLPPKQKQKDEYLDMSGNNNNRFSRPNGSNGSLRRLGDSNLVKDESSSDEDNPDVETVATIEPQPPYRPISNKYDTFV